MLQQRAVLAQLRGADELGAVDHQLARAGLREAGRARGAQRPAGRPGDRGPHAQSRERREEQRVDRRVGVAQRERGRGRRDAVGHLTMVEQGAPAGRPAHDIDPPFGEPGGIEAIAGALVAPQREGGPEPAIGAQRRHARAARLGHQRGVEGHVGGAVGGRGREQPPPGCERPHARRARRVGGRPCLWARVPHARQRVSAK